MHREAECAVKGFLAKRHKGGPTAETNNVRGSIAVDVAYKSRVRLVRPPLRSSHILHRQMQLCECFAAVGRRILALRDVDARTLQKQ